MSSKPCTIHSIRAILSIFASRSACQSHLFCNNTWLWLSKLAILWNKTKTSSSSKVSQIRDYSTWFSAPTLFHQMAKKLHRKTSNQVMRFSRLAWNFGTFSRMTFFRNPTKTCLKIQMASETVITCIIMVILPKGHRLFCRVVLCIVKFILVSWTSYVNLSWTTWPNQRKCWLKSMRMAMLCKFKLMMSKHFTSTSKCERHSFSWQILIQMPWISVFKADLIKSKQKKITSVLIGWTSFVGLLVQFQEQCQQMRKTLSSFL